MQSTDGTRELNNRVLALDSEFIHDCDARDSCPSEQKIVIRDIKAFVSILRHVTSPGMHDKAPIVSSGEADEIISTCHLIGRIGDHQPELAKAGAIGHPQYWVSTGVPSWLPARDPKPSIERFIPPAAARQSSWVNPLGMGFYTSTGFLGRQGMWRIYLDFDPDSSLFPKPWHVWRLDPDTTARVYNIASAADWEGLVIRYPRFDGGLLFPDWKSIADDWDAVHMTLGAIAAIQGIRLRTPRGLLAPSYWDVESTFWLRWTFTSAVHVETVAAADA